MVEFIDIKVSETRTKLFFIISHEIDKEGEESKQSRAEQSRAGQRAERERVTHLPLQVAPIAPFKRRGEKIFSSHCMFSLKS